MKSPLFYLFAGLFMFQINMYLSMAQTPPAPKKIPFTLTKNGDNRVDQYYWLKERENPKVIDYLEAENAYLEQVLSPVKDLRTKLFEECKSRIKEDDETYPEFHNGYYYYSRYETGKEYPIYCRKKGRADADEEVILNVNELAKGHSYYSLGSYAVSPDNQYLAFSADTLARRKFNLYFKDLSSGKIIDPAISNTGGDQNWANDNQTVIYTSVDEKTLRYDRVFRYNFVKAGKPEEVYYEKDETFYYVSTGKTKDNKFLTINCLSTLSSETLILDADKPEGNFKPFLPREKDHLYSIEHHNDNFYIKTNWNALNFRLMECPESATAKESWKDVIAHRKNVLIEAVDVFNDFLVLSERKNGLVHLRVINLTNKLDYYIDFVEETYTVYTSGNPEMNSRVLRLVYSSPTTPKTVFDYDMINQLRVMRKMQEVPGSFNKSDYEAKRVYAIAPDGVKVPISLVYRKGIELNGNNPLLLYGYGSYGYSIDAGFSTNRLSLLDRGFVYAIAHVRGGEELGRSWYEDGKLMKKKNTFTDFIACAEHLINLKYTNPEKLFAMGGSAGGLLMGAIANMRPDLWKGIVAAVPFVDVITTMDDPDIPLTTAEYDEWGNPNDAAAYKYMKSYSPYDNVSAVKYPNILATTGLHDSQVQYWEPAKWVAKLREMKKDKNHVLLHTNMEAGHGGASGRFESLKEIALEYAFILWLSGIKE
jgi:oligopeptidase B